MKPERNIRLQVEYDGTQYCGWQSQGKRKSIQGTLEKALRKILQEKIHLTGSGRTDAGVHALAQIANFYTKSGIKLERLQIALNGLLPEDISVSAFKDVSLDFHSRFGANSKVYRYTVLNRKHPSALLKGKVYFYPHKLNISLIRREAAVLAGKHDFKAFQASDKVERHSVRTIKKISVTKKNGFIYFDIEADGFLYNMVRNIVGTLIEIGRGRFSAGSMKKILASRNRKLAGRTVPAKGLCLLEVKY
jgi:tRNA pseudouridine38-40 synthase